MESELDKININSFEQIIIKEYSLNNYLVDFVINDKSVKTIKFTDNEKIIEFIYNCLNSDNIYGFTKLPPLALGTNDETLVNCGKFQLRMKLYNPKIKCISWMISNKYINDRYEVFLNDDFIQLHLDVSNKSFGYLKNNQVMKLVLSEDNNGNISKADRDFFLEYINYKFSLLGEKVEVLKVIKENNKILMGETIDKYIVKCGNFEIIIPNKFQFMYLLNMINAYSNDKNKKRKR